MREMNTETLNGAVGTLIGLRPGSGRCGNTGSRSGCSTTVDSVCKSLNARMAESGRRLGIGSTERKADRGDGEGGKAGLTKGM